MINVLLADDHAILREGLKEILLRDLEGAVCGEAENAQQVLAQVQRQAGISRFWTSPCRDEAAWMFWVS